MKATWWDDQNHANKKEWPDKRVNGWAPGNYTCTCADCGVRYLGDKRSVQCYPCASKIKPAAPPDTCPFCRARRDEYSAGENHWECGSFHFHAAGRDPYQSQTCARYVRTLISQLRRMAEQAFRVFDRLPHGKKTVRHAQQLDRFRTSCLREIDRLQGAP